MTDDVRDELPHDLNPAGFGEVVSLRVRNSKVLEPALNPLLIVISLGMTARLLWGYFTA